LLGTRYFALFAKKKLINYVKYGTIDWSEYSVDGEIFFSPGSKKQGGFCMSEVNSSWITLTPFGGSNTVTGSCHLVRVNTRGGEKYYLVDCGAFSGKDGRRINMNISHLATKIDAVFITHAHVDHTGRLPYLYKMGYRGPIYATKAVRELSRLMLLDSARIQEQDYQQLIRKASEKNKHLIKLSGVKPLYSQEDAANVMNQFVNVKRGKTISIDDTLEVCFYNAGHSLGSSSVMLTLNNGDERHRVYFSGDIGQNNTILKKRRDIPKVDVDTVVMESTYAGRFQGDKNDTWRGIRQTIAETITRGGNVIFPTFAVGRTQEILYLYYKDMMENSDEVAEVLKATPVYIDSALAVSAMECFSKFPDEFSAQVRRSLKDEYNNPFCFPNLIMIGDGEGSKKLISRENNYVVFSSSGMCNAGRVLYHLTKDLPDPNSTIIFTGYQAEGTLGREIVAGSKEVEIHGELIPVRAKIVFMNSFSAHTDQNGLIDWLSKIQGDYTLFLSHGEPERQIFFREEIAAKGIVSRESIALMTYGREYHLRKGEYDVTTFSKSSRWDMFEKDRHTMKKGRRSDLQNLIEYVDGLLADGIDDHDAQSICEVGQKLRRDRSKSNIKMRNRRSRMIG